MGAITASCGHRIKKLVAPCYFNMGNGLCYGVLCPQCEAKFKVDYNGEEETKEKSFKEQTTQGQEEE